MPDEPSSPVGKAEPADEMDYRRCLEAQSACLGALEGHLTDWTPLAGRPGVFPEDIDGSDPWLLRNILVH